MIVKMSDAFTCGSSRPNAEDWQQLRCQMSPEHAFLTGGWMEAWAESYLPLLRWRGPCRYLSVRDAAGRLTGALPLAHMKFGPVQFRAVGGFRLPYRGVALALRQDVRTGTCAAMAEALRRGARGVVGMRIGPIAEQ